MNSPDGRVSVTFNDRWRALADAKIHRCTCGGWVWADNTCSACGQEDDEERTG